jgi:hypothetical protein
VEKFRAISTGSNSCECSSDETIALSRIPFSDEGGSIFWGSKFKRPLEGKMGRIVTQLTQAAREHYEQGSRKSKEITVGGVTLDLIAFLTTVLKGRKHFVRGGQSDLDELVGK